MKARVLATAFLAVALLGGCGDSDDDGPAAVDNQARPAQEESIPPADERDDPSSDSGELGYSDDEGLEATEVELVVDGEPTVLYEEYGLPNTTGYSTAVAFRVTNPTDLMVQDAAYRVELLAGDGTLMERSSGETVTLWPGQSRDVVVRLDPEGPSGPASARVQMYAADGYSLEQGDPMLAAGPDAWNAENVAGTCDFVTVGCDVSGDLIFGGEADMDVRKVTVVVRNGDGRVVAAGADFGNVADTVQPNRPVPFQVQVIGAVDDQIQAANLAVVVDADWGSAG